MLVLTRHAGEEIIIGDNLLRIKVLGIGSNTICLGFDAAKDLSIHRKEIFDKI